MKHTLKILLDYDDTARILNKKDEYVNHPELDSLIKLYDVIVYSGNPDAEKLANEYNIPFIFKGDDVKPKADILIDDMKLEIQESGFADYFDVKHVFDSIDSFFSWVKTKKL